MCKVCRVHKQEDKEVKKKEVRKRTGIRLYKHMLKEECKNKLGRFVMYFDNTQISSNKCHYCCLCCSIMYLLLFMLFIHVFFVILLNNYIDVMCFISNANV